MSGNRNTNSANGIGVFGVFGLLGIAFVVLKLMEYITWSWWWVTAPFWGPWVLVAVILIISLLLYLVMKLIK